MRLLSFIYSYYESPRMFLRQLEEWEQYPDRVKSQLAIYVTDDCSMEWTLSRVIRFPEGIEGHAFRLTRKVPYNGYSCLNLGAHFANTKWLLLTDIDHVVTKEAVVEIMEYLEKIDERFVYKFQRVDASRNTPVGIHNFSFLMTRDLYWKIGGHDEDMAGIYYNGASKSFRMRMKRKAEGVKILPISLLKFGNDIISDASFTGFSRNKSDDRKRVREVEKRKYLENRSREVRTLLFPYQEVYEKAEKTV